VFATLSVSLSLSAAAENYSESSKDANFVKLSPARVELQNELLSLSLSCS